MGLRSMIRDADLLGPPITLTLNGSETVKTYFGSIMTLVLFAATMASSVYFVIKFFDKSSPTVTESTVRYQEFQPIDFAAGKHIPIFFVRGNDQKAVPNELSMKMIRPKLTANYQKKINGIYELNFETFENAPCKEIYTDKTYLDYFSDVDNWELVKNHILNNGICIKIEKEKQELVRSDNPNAGLSESTEEKKEYYNLFYGVRPCDLALTPDCLSKKYFSKLTDDNLFGESTIEFIFPHHVLNLENSENPVKKYWEIEEGSRVQSFSTYPTYYYSHYMTVIEDESQYLGEKKQAGSFITLDMKDPTFFDRKTNDDSPNEIVYECDSSNLDDVNAPERVCDYFMQIGFLPERKELNFNRRYTQLPDLLSEIGGIYSLLTDLFSFISGIVLNIIKSNYYIAGLFPMLPLRSFTCSKKKYKEVSKQVDSDIKKHNKYWNDLGEEAVEMVESSIDLAVLFQEICKIRVIANLLLDDKQKEMITLASFYQFKNEKEANEESEKKEKEDSDAQMKKSRKNRAKIYYELKHRLRKKEEIQTGEGATEGDQQFESRLARKIDEEIVKAYKDLKLDSLEVHDDPEFDDFKRLDSDNQKEESGIQENNDLANPQGEGQPNKQNLDPENPENLQLLPQEDTKKQLRLTQNIQPTDDPKEKVIPKSFFNDTDEGLEGQQVRVKFSVGDQK